MICIDASVGAKWILTEPWTDRADALAAFAVRTNTRLISSPLFAIEVGNVIRQRERRFHMPMAEAEAKFDELLAYPVTLVPVDHLHLDALRLCDQFELPAIYDAYYVLIAQQFGCDFWTDDRRLLKTLNGRLPFVRWIGEFG
jgi:predicted nucleic acid-binding protein